MKGYKERWKKGKTEERERTKEKWRKGGGERVLVNEQEKISFHVVDSQVESDCGEEWLCMQTSC